LPSLNSGAYGSLGIANPDPTSPTGFFYARYMKQTFVYNPSTGLYRVPPALVCPGADGGGRSVNSWMPGHPDGLYQIGEPTWVGVVIGFGSFLGLEWGTPWVETPPYNGNGVINGISVRPSQLKHPSSEVILVDGLYQRGTGSSYSSNPAWN